MTDSENNFYDRRDFRGVGPRGYRRSDERIFEEVCERLTQHGQVDASDIEVQVHESEVTLRGTVDSRQAKRLAENVADGVSGVTDVHNELKIQHREPEDQYQSGQPGGGAGRVDRVGKSGVYPVSGPWPEGGDAPVQGEMSWGQGERGEEGYFDSGSSETHYP